jgi:hypothetical protein
VVPLARAAGGHDRAIVELEPADALRLELADARERVRHLEAEVAFLRRQRENAQPRREAVRAELGQRDEARAERDAAVAARDAAIADRDQVVRERDILQRELRDRDAVAEGAARRREQALEERDRALAEPAGVVPAPARAPREHGAESQHADWAARTAAILALLVLLVLAISFLKAIG